MTTCPVQGKHVFSLASQNIREGYCSGLYCPLLERSISWASHIRGAGQCCAAAERSNIDNDKGGRSLSCSRGGETAWYNTGGSHGADPGNERRTL